MEDPQREIFGVQDEMDLASRLLEAHDEAGLDQFVGSLLKRAGGTLRLPLGRHASLALARRLRRAARQLGFPELSRLRLAAIEAPQLPSQAPALVSRAARLFGIELEGLSPEDKDFEIARRFVRFGGEAARQLAARQGALSAVPLALAKAARLQAPGLVRAPAQTSSSGCGCGCGTTSCGCATPANSSNHDTAARSLDMHDLDHTKAELDPETDSFELDEIAQMEFSDELDESEFDAGEYDSGEYDAGEFDAGELDETGSPFSEVEESELASELLGIQSEEEMDQFLGKIFKRAFRGVRGLTRSLGGIVKPLGGMLKGVAKKLLPIAAGAAGTFFGGPMGGAIGSKLGSVVGNALESELSGMSPEDRDFEVARTFVRMAGSAAKQAAQAPAQLPAASAAKDALVRVTRSTLPRLRRRRAGQFGHSYGQSYGRGLRSGRWVRRGNRIIIFGV